MKGILHISSHLYIPRTQKVKMQRRNPISVSQILLLSSSILVLTIFSRSSSAEMAETPASGSCPEAKVYIIYTERPEEGVDPEPFHVKTLASVYGSEEAAKGALLYSYKHAASGFSAKLTPQQVDQLSKQPGVLQVVPSQTMQLHSGPAKLNI